MTTSVDPSPQHDAILQRLSYLEEALTAQDPQIKEHLKETHKLLITHEELVHLLSEEEIGKIMQGQQIITNTVLIAAVTPKNAKAAATKKAAQISLGDI